MANTEKRNTPFVKGNQYWKIAVENGTIGKNKEYTPKELAEKINEWIELTSKSVWKKEEFIKAGPQAGQKVYLETATPFLIQDLCLYLRVNRNYFTQLAKQLEGKEDSESSEYSRIISHVDQLCTNQKMQGALIGAYNPMLVSRLEGLTDKQDITSNGETVVSSVSFVFGVQNEGNKAIGEGIQHKLEKE